MCHHEVGVLTGRALTQVVDAHHSEAVHGVRLQIVNCEGSAIVRCDGGTQQAPGSRLTLPVKMARG